MEPANNTRKRMKVVKLTKPRKLGKSLASIGTDSVKNMASLNKRPAIEKLASAVTPLKSVQNSRKNLGQIRYQLLKDLFRVFKSRKVQSLRTRDIIAELCSDSSKPWASYHRGSSIVPRQLANLLKPWGVSSCDLYFKAGNAKGYQYRDIKKAYRSNSK